VNRSEWHLVLGAVAAVAVPAAVLHFTADADRHAAGLSAAPFAWPRVLVAHLVAALPLGFILARWARSMPAVKDTARGLWAAIGIGAAGAAAVVCPGIGEAVAGEDAGAVPLLVLRSLIAVTLVTPWCVAALDPPAGPSAVGRPGLVVGLGIGLAVVPCGLYAEAVIAARTEQARDLLDRERLVKAEGVLTGLVELGSDRPVLGRPPAEARQEVMKRIPRLRQAAAYPLPPAAPPADRLGRAFVLIQLDRLDEAAELLAPLAAGDATAELLLATVYRDQEKWAASDERFADALEKLLPLAAADPNARGMCRTAFEGLAFNARLDRRPADAERALTRGLEELPSEAAYFHFQLGRHYADGGRPGKAMDHFRRAADLDPGKYGKEVGEQTRSLRTHTPGCFLPGR
jgi:hypothetical protein